LGYLPSSSPALGSSCPTPKSLIFPPFFCFVFSFLFEKKECEMSSWGGNSLQVLDKSHACWVIWSGFVYQYSINLYYDFHKSSPKYKVEMLYVSSLSNPRIHQVIVWIHVIQVLLQYRSSFVVYANLSCFYANLSCLLNDHRRLGHIVKLQILIFERW